MGSDVSKHFFEWGGGGIGERQHQQQRQQHSGSSSFSRSFATFGGQFYFTGAGATIKPGWVSPKGATWRCQGSGRCGFYLSGVCPQ